MTGPVIGFLLAGDDLETVYVSGDNGSLDVVRQIAKRVGPVHTAILFAGGVQLARRFDSAYLRLSADRAAEATLILEAQLAIPLHFEGWTHLTRVATSCAPRFAVTA